MNEPACPTASPGGGPPPRKSSLKLPALPAAAGLLGAAVILAACSPPITTGGGRTRTLTFTPTPAPGRFALSAECSPEATPVTINTKAPGTALHTIPLSTLLQRERELTDTPLMTAVKDTICTRPNSVVENIKAGAPGNPENVRRVERIIDSAAWEYLFPRRAPEYTYLNFLKAAAKFPAFCGGPYDNGWDADAICRKSLAVMFAHFTQETGGHTKWWKEPEWRQGLVWVREMNWTEEMRGGYNSECDPKVWQGQTWPCGKFPNGDFKSYFGRGSSS